MATIYRFIAEDKTLGIKSGGIKDENASSKAVAKSIKKITGSNKGVEHNRRMRAINPLINKVTGGYWEKGMRAGRAIQGMGSTYMAEGGLAALGSVGGIILAQLALMMFIQWYTNYLKEQDKLNAQDYKRLELGVDNYSYGMKVSKNLLTQRVNYGDNK